MNELHLAAFEGNLDKVKLLTTANTVNELHREEKNTPIYWAVKAGHLEIVEYLLSQGASLGPPDYKPHFDLFWQARTIHDDFLRNKIIRFFLDKKLYKKINNDLTECHLYTALGCLDEIKRFIDESLSSSMFYYQSFVYIAAARGHEDIINYFYSEERFFYTNVFNPITFVGVSPQCVAAHRNRLNILKNFHARRINLNLPNDAGDFKGETPIFCACENGSTEVVMYLINEIGIDASKEIIVENEGYHCAVIAAENGHLDILKFFNNINMNLNVSISIGKNKGTTPLFGACKYGHVHIVEYLINTLGINAIQEIILKDNEITTCAYEAASRGYLEIIKKLHESRINLAIPITAGKLKGRIPLFTACLNGKADVVNYLIKTVGIDPRLELTLTYGKDSYERIAAEHNNVNVLKILHASKVNLTLPITQGRYKNWTPLYTACSYGSLQVVSYLIFELGINETKEVICDDGGNCCAVAAASNGHVEVLKLLHKANYDLNTPIKALGELKGVTPLSAACIHGHATVINYLIDEANISSIIEPSECENKKHLPLLSMITNHAIGNMINTQIFNHWISIIKKLIKLGVKRENIHDGNTAIDICLNKIPNYIIYYLTEIELALEHQIFFYQKLIINVFRKKLSFLKNELLQLEIDGRIRSINNQELADFLYEELTFLENHLCSSDFHLLSIHKRKFIEIKNQYLISNISEKNCNTSQPNYCTESERIELLQLIENIVKLNAYLSHRHIKLWHAELSEPIIKLKIINSCTGLNCEDNKMTFFSSSLKRPRSFDESKTDKNSTSLKLLTLDINRDADRASYLK